ncbi:MAG: hypothetical protein KAX13_07920, partial [Candidatus Krumholzibacteria bacterium]|nr:hypothetical protein [Candidatus Krumholzibacteria bacterium]
MLLLLSSPVFSAPGTGTATIDPADDVTAGAPGTWTIIYVASELFDSGELEIHIPDNWTPPQILNASLPGYVTVSTTGRLDDPALGISEQRIIVNIDSLAAGDSVYVVYGDTSGNPGGIATAQTTAESSVEFTVRSDTDGFSSGPIVNSPTLNVLAGPITSLIFKTSSQTITAGGESNVMRIRTEDVYGNPSSVPADQDITLSTTSGTGTFSHLPGGSWSDTTTVTITSGADTVSFYYRDSTAGTFSITASADGQAWPSAQQPVTVEVADPYRLVVTPEDTTATAGDYVRFRLEVQDQYGNTSPVAADQTITLFPGGGIFYDKDDHGTQLTELVISSGSSSAEVDYRHTVMDTDQGYVLAFWDQDIVPPSLTTASTSIYIDFANADAAVSELEGDKSTITADDLDELEVTVTIRDAFGNPVSGSSVTLEATGTGNTIVDPGVTGT